MFGVALCAKKLTVNILRLRTHALNFALTFSGRLTTLEKHWGPLPCDPVCIYMWLTVELWGLL